MLYSWIVAACCLPIGTCLIEPIVGPGDARVLAGQGKGHGQVCLIVGKTTFAIVGNWYWPCRRDSVRRTRGLYGRSRKAP